MVSALQINIRRIVVLTVFALSAAVEDTVPAFAHLPPERLRKRTRTQGDEDFGLIAESGGSTKIQQDNSCYDHSVGSAVDSWLAHSAASSHATNSSQHMYNSVARRSVLKMADGNALEVQGCGYSSFRMEVDRLSHFSG